VREGLNSGGPPGGGMQKTKKAHASTAIPGTRGHHKNADARHIILMLAGRA